MTRSDAFDVLQSVSQSDFHALSGSEVETILSHANRFRYRNRKNANGSRARMFFEHAKRVAARAQ